MGPCEDFWMKSAVSRCGHVRELQSTDSVVYKGVRFRHATGGKLSAGVRYGYIET